MTAFAAPDAPPVPGKLSPNVFAPDQLTRLEALSAARILLPDAGPATLFEVADYILGPAFTMAEVNDWLWGPAPTEPPSEEVDFHGVPATCYFDFMEQLLAGHGHDHVGVVDEDEGEYVDELWIMDGDYEHMPVGTIAWDEETGEQIVKVDEINWKFDDKPTLYSHWDLPRKVFNPEILGKFYPVE